MQPAVVKALFYRREGEEPEIRRFQIPPDVEPSYPNMREKLVEIFTDLSDGQFNTYWQDSEGDFVIFSSQEEMMEAVKSTTDSVLRITVKRTDIARSTPRVTSLDDTSRAGNRAGESDLKTNHLKSSGGDEMRRQTGKWRRLRWANSLPRRAGFCDSLDEHKTTRKNEMFPSSCGKGETPVRRRMWRGCGVFDSWAPNIGGPVGAPRRWWRRRRQEQLLKELQGLHLEDNESASLRLYPSWMSRREVHAAASDTELFRPDKEQTRWRRFQRSAWKGHIRDVVSGLNDMKVGEEEGIPPRKTSYNWRLHRSPMGAVSNSFESCQQRRSRCWKRHVRKTMGESGAASPGIPMTWRRRRFPNVASEDNNEENGPVESTVGHPADEADRICGGRVDPSRPQRRLAMKMKLRHQMNEEMLNQTPRKYVDEDSETEQPPKPKIPNPRLMLKIHLRQQRQQLRQERRWYRMMSRMDTPDNIPKGKPQEPAEGMPYETFGRPRAFQRYRFLKVQRQRARIARLYWAGMTSGGSPFQKVSVGSPRKHGFIPPSASQQKALKLKKMAVRRQRLWMPANPWPLFWSLAPGTFQMVPPRAFNRYMKAVCQGRMEPWCRKEEKVLKCRRK